MITFKKRKIENFEFLEHPRVLRSYFPFGLQNLLPRQLRIIIHKLIKSKNNKIFFNEAEATAIENKLTENNKDSNPNFSNLIFNTHDIDSIYGFTAIEDLLKLENDYNIKSIWFVNYAAVCNQKQSLKIIEKLLNAGAEIGLHDIIHDFKTPYLDEINIRKKLDSARSFCEKYKIIAYRSAGLFRTKKMFEILKDYFKIDSSIPAFLVSNRGACYRLNPFKISDILEIPVTAPMDSDLIFADLSEQEMLDCLKKYYILIDKFNGCITQVTYTEPHFFGNKKYFTIYKKVLELLLSHKKIRLFRELITN